MPTGLTGMAEPEVATGLTVHHTRKSPDAARDKIARCMPKAPVTREQAGISSALIEDLFLRHVHLKRCNTIGATSESTALAYPIVERVFRDLRNQRLLEVSGMLGDDYVFALTNAGRTMAAERCRMCQYAGPAPVSLTAYQRAILDQRPQVVVNQASLRLAFGDLVVTDRLLDQLGPALVAQNSIFLYGPAGTGKTSLAQRLLRVYGDQLVMPYAVEVDNQIIVVFDPAVHERVEIDIDDADPRWIVCHRPCVMVGGELVPSMLELRLDETSGTYAPPVQMKANGGMLVIDDFGRQLISPRDLLNRWIVPLDRRLDYLSLNYGVRFHIPFEVMIVFATNLEPSELADEAFLRRIPNKILVDAVAPEVFDEIFRRVLAKFKMACDEGSYEHLRKLCLERGGDLRPSYPRDMCQIIRALKTYEEKPLRVGKADLDRAVELFFGAMQSGHSG
ncbi:MAG TPA: hypothetical protein VMT86_09665 [Bryobacteraceae bacterium]|nr:hypothetical protein [Bryobacteraceae bacterium]